VVRRGQKTWFETVEEVQVVLDAYLLAYNTKRPHQGRGMKGRTPITAFGEGLRRRGKMDAAAATSSTKLRKEKTNLERSAQTPANLSAAEAAIVSELPFL
jgi:hypothetical protein